MVVLSILILFGSSAWAADWLTDGGDVMRNNWQKDEKIINTKNAKDIKLLWKIKLDNEPRQMHSLLPPLVIGSLNTSSRQKQVAIQAGVSDNLYAIDVATGELLWKRHFDSTYQDPPGGRGPSVLCPGGMTANVTIGPGGAPGKYTIYAASWDGRLWQVNAANGKDVVPPGKFMPPNGKPYAMKLFNNVIYTHSAQGCGGNPNMAYTYDLATHKVGSWGPAGGGMWGRSGPAISANGTMYTGTGDGRWDPENGLYGNGIIGVKHNPETKSLDLVDYYGPSRRLAGQARSRHAGDASHFSLRAKFTWWMPARVSPYHGHESIARRSSDACVSHALICNEMVDFAEAGMGPGYRDGRRHGGADPFGGQALPVRAGGHGIVKKGAIAVQSGTEEWEDAAFAGVDFRDMGPAAP
jgi:hypothetical protein